MTAAKVAAMKRRQEREQSRYPLFSEQIAAQQAPIDVSAEESIRQAMFEKSQQSMRDLHAGFWRSTRRRYFAATQEQRAAIRAEWNRWVGPVEPMYFAYVVDKHTGESDRRLAEMKARDLVIARKVFEDLQRQDPLPLGPSADSSA